MHFKCPYCGKWCDSINEYAEGPASRYRRYAMNDVEDPGNENTDLLREIDDRESYDINIAKLEYQTYCCDHVILEGKEAIDNDVKLKAWIAKQDTEPTEHIQ